MGPDLSAAPAVLRCPSCTGAVRPGAPWCTQCFADLRPAPAAPAGPEPAQPAAAVPAAAVVPADAAVRAAAAVPADTAVPADAAVAGAQAAATWPCVACGTRNPLASAACSACGTGFLAPLRAGERPLLVLPVVGDLAALSRAARLGLAAAVVALVLLLTALGGLLLS